MPRRFSYRITALILPLILSGLLANRTGFAAGRVSNAGSTAECTQLLTAVGNDPLKLGSLLFGALPGVELNSVLSSPTQRLTLQLADELADAAAAQVGKPPAQPAQSPWHQEIPTLYQSIASYPGPALNDLAEELGLDQGLWEIVVQSFKTQNQPFDQEHVTHTAQWIRQGLGYLNYTGSGNARGASPRLKALFISFVVLGRFGTEPWNAAGKLVEQALPVAERDEVFKLLKDSPVADRGFIPAFDEVSGEWGMREPETGLIWFNASRSRVGYEEAIAYCKSKNQSLPSREQWRTAESHGIRDVFREMWTLMEENWARSFRSSTPIDRVHAYVFNSYYGSARYSAYREGRDNNVFASVFARCVSTAHGVKR